MNQENISICGHSIEARIYAEIPENNFMPDTGKLQYFRFPKDSADLRVETGVQESKTNYYKKLIEFLDDEISIFYDPMIAKVISRGGDRNEAIQRLDQALSELKVYVIYYILKLCANNFLGLRSRNKHSIYSKSPGN